MELRERAGPQERSLKNLWGLEARFGLVYQMSHNEKLIFVFAQSKVRKGPPWDYRGSIPVVECRGALGR